MVVPLVLNLSRIFHEINNPEGSTMYGKSHGSARFLSALRTARAARTLCTRALLIGRLQPMLMAARWRAGKNMGNVSNMVKLVGEKNG